MRKDAQRTLLEQVAAWIRLSAIATLVCLVLLHLVTAWVAQGRIDWTALYDLFRTLIVEFIPVTLLFLLSSVLLRRYTEHRERIVSHENTALFSREVDRVVRQALVDQHRDALGASLYQSFDDIDWNEQLKDARELTVVVHYLDSWLRRAEPSLRALVRNGGRVSVLISDPQRTQLVDCISSRFPDRSRQEILSKIRETPNRIARACGPQVATDQLDVASIPILVWYSAFCVDNRYLFLSPFEHARGNRIGSPVTRIDLELYPETRAWFGDECQYLRSTVPNSIVEVGHG